MSTPHQTRLSVRIRPNSEAAPWVIAEVQNLEEMLDDERRANKEAADTEEFLRRSLAEAFADCERLRAENTRLRADYDDLRQRALVTSELRLDQIADLREALIMIQHTIGDLRNGFARSVEPARWVEQLQGFINTVLDKTTPV